LTLVEALQEKGKNLNIHQIHHNYSEIQVYITEIILLFFPQ